MLASLFLLLASNVAGSPGPLTQEQAVERAREVLVEQRGVDPSTLRLRSVHAVEWPDAGLGCAEEGKAYAQVVTPGYRVLLYAGTVLHRVHVGGQRALVCGEPISRDRQGRKQVPEQVPEPDDAGVTGEVPENILDAVEQDLSKRTGAEPAAIEVVRAEAMVWSDGSLGCPEPGVNYTMAPTQGYRVILRHGDREYDYRVAARSGFPVLCDGPRNPGVGSPPRQ